MVQNQPQPSQKQVNAEVTPDPNNPAIVPDDESELSQRANVILPAQLLEPGEIVILMLKPSLLFILLVPLRFLIATALITGTLFYLDPLISIGINTQAIAATGMTIIVLRLFWQFLEWMARVYVLTDRRVITISGVLRVLIFETALSRIQHTEVSILLRERLFNLGTLIITTAGTATNETYWFMIERPLDAHAKLLEALRRYR